MEPLRRSGPLAGVAGGAGGTRTPDPLNAIEVLSQLSYSPTVSISKITAGWQSPCAGRAGPAVRTNRL